MSRAVVFTSLLLVVCFWHGAAVDPPTSKKKETKRESTEDGFVLAPPYYSSAISARFYIMPILKIPFEKMAPWIDAEAAMVHFLGVQQMCTDNMNALLAEWRKEDPDDKLAKQPLFDMLKKLDSVPEQYRIRARDNIGCFVNHNIYWGLLTATNHTEPKKPTGKLLDDIVTTFGSYEEFKERFTQTALNLTGSGYVWLVRKSNSATADLEIVTTRNEDSPLSVGLLPIVALDVWEHAYYTKHKYNRKAYIDDWWMVLNWLNVADLETFLLTGYVNYDRSNSYY